MWVSIPLDMNAVVCKELQPPQHIIKFLNGGVRN